MSTKKSSEKIVLHRIKLPPPEGRKHSTAKCEPVKLSSGSSRATVKSAPTPVTKSVDAEDDDDDMPELPVPKQHTAALPMSMMNQHALKSPGGLRAKLRDRRKAMAAVRTKGAKGIKEEAETGNCTPSQLNALMGTLSNDQRQMMQSACSAMGMGELAHNVMNGERPSDKTVEQARASARAMGLDDSAFTAT